MTRLCAAALAAGAIFFGAGVARGETERDRAAGGDHWRIETRRGPVHVWRPDGYRHETAGIVFYVHGYVHDVDRAWEEHALAEQFQESGRNALFILPEAPISARHPVLVPDLGDLLRTVRQEAGVARPWGPVIGLIHSGGYRTARTWLDDGILDRLILVDGFYGGEEEFAAWLDDPDHQMVVVAFDTLRWTELWLELFAVPSPRLRVGIPERASDFTEPDREARLLYILSQIRHMKLVTEGEVLPLLLRFTRLDGSGT